MKILGESGDHWNRKFICEISDKEIGQVFNKYTSGDVEGLVLKAGKEIDLSQGYNFRNEIVSATRAMVTAYESFKQASDTMLRFAELAQIVEDRKS